MTVSTENAVQEVRLSHLLPGTNVHLRLVADDGNGVSLNFSVPQCKSTRGRATRVGLNSYAIANEDELTVVLTSGDEFLNLDDELVVGKELCSNLVCFGFKGRLVVESIRLI